ncbi:MAG: MarR family transcriptional regulator [Oscillospiraceae bacterium]|jgi:DNA-binding MarR family transcriptional regulator|nr:MarR family transcriptional regulator [Oscillospiraceae bacterium]
MDDIYLKLARLQWLLHMQQLRGDAARDPTVDPSRGQGRILAALKLQDGISAKDLAFVLGITVSSLNELLGKLEKNGYVTRASAEDDKRIILVRLTEKGRALEQADTLPESVFTCFTPEELRTFGEYLERLTIALEEEIHDVPGFDAEHMEHIRRRFGEKFDHLNEHMFRHYGRR